MINLFRAEWSKAAGHRWLAGFLIWIFPVGTIVMYVLLIITALSSATTAIESFNLATTRWTDAMGVWGVLSDFPGNVIGRMPILAFIASLFAGEFEWGTWKNIVPRNRRAALVLTKFITLGIYVMVAFAAISLIVLIGNGIALKIVGLPYGPAVTGENLTDFAGDYSLNAGLAFISTLIVSAFAALAALFTRKIVGGVMVGFLISIIEPNTLLLLLWIINFLDKPELVSLYRYMPTYSIGNISSWIKHHTALGLGMPIPFPETSLGFSLIVVLVWVVVLIGLVMVLFQRQDITS
jgi:ABC-type transport system involved in multi-copper enzyme maturation permease subunit